MSQTATLSDSTQLPSSMGQKTMSGSLPVTIASDQTAIPISVASLPLPSGAATAANQCPPGAAGTPNSAVGTVQGIANGTPVAVSGSVAVSALPTATMFKRVSTADTNAAVVKSSPGSVSSLQTFNNTSTPRFLKLYDKALAPIMGGLGAPTGLAASLAAGGSLPLNQTAYYKITGTNANGETMGSAEVSVTPTVSGTQSASLTWTQLAGASGYKIYRSTSSGGEGTSPALLTTIPLGSTVSYTDNGSAVSAGAVPATDTTYDVPKKTIGIPAFNPNGAGNNVTFSQPVGFGNGIAIAITAGMADNDTTPCAANDCVVNIDRN